MQWSLKCINQIGYKRAVHYIVILRFSFFELCWRKFTSLEKRQKVSSNIVFIVAVILSVSTLSNCYEK